MRSHQNFRAEPPKIEHMLLCEEKSPKTKEKQVQTSRSRIQKSVYRSVPDSKHAIARDDVDKSSDPLISKVNDGPRKSDRPCVLARKIYK